MDTSPAANKGDDNDNPPYGPYEVEKVFPAHVIFCINDLDSNIDQRCGGHGETTSVKAGYRFSNEGGPPVWVANVFHQHERGKKYEEAEVQEEYS